MAVTNLEIVRSEPYADGERFGNIGAYRRIEAIAHYAVNPEHPANAGLTDLKLAPRNNIGLVEFSGDVSLLLPEDLSRANGALLVEVPNRGNRILPRSFNQAPVLLSPSDDIDPGDGFLMRHGYCLAWVGWQWDMPECVERLGLNAPVVPEDKLGSRTRMQLRIQPNRHEPTFRLTDHHVGSVGRHTPIRPGARNDAQAALLVREHVTAPPTTIARERWRFVGDGPNAVELDGGFDAGRIYDLLYTPAECRVGACGLLAVRDFASYARFDEASPLNNAVTHAIGEGISQCGRFLRSFMHLGLNQDEAGRQVYDGILAHVAGGKRGEFNQRYGQPSVQPTPALGHRFPFADEPQRDPQTGQTSGLLDRLRERAVMPKVMYTDTSSEYWRGDAGLTHSHLQDDTDVDTSPDVRRYLFASTQHGAGLLPYADESVFGSHGTNLFNAVDYRPLFRAALENLRAWVMCDVEPPKSVFPRRSDGTGATREAVADALAAIPDLHLPAMDRLTGIYLYDFGARVGEGVNETPARIVGDAYATVVSAVDDAGNETGGLRLPDVEVPVATHTGFNPRKPVTGGEGQLLEYVGTTLPRQELVARYETKDTYLQQIRVAAEKLAAKRIVLDEDIDLCVANAAERYDAAIAYVENKS
jgi:hypothetical protein